MSLVLSFAIGFGDEIATGSELLILYTDVGVECRYLTSQALS